MSFLNSFLDSVINGANDASANVDFTVTLSCNSSSFNLPINPSEISLNVQNKNNVLNIINAGEYNMIGKTGLKNLTLQSFFPVHEYSFANGTADGYSYINKIENWRLSGNVCNICISGTPIDFPCLIEDFSYAVKDGTGDIYYTLKLKEYRYIEGMTPTKINAKTGLNQRPESFLQKAANNFKMYPGENPLKAISRAVGKTIGTDANFKQIGYLDVYQKVMKKGGIKAGDIINMTTKHSIKVGDKNVDL